MNSELKVIIFEQKKILQNLLKLLDEQYNLVLNKDVIALGKIAEDIEEEGKKLATIEIKRRNIASEEEFNKIKNNLNLIDENFEDVGNDYSNRIDEIDVRPGSLDVTPVDMCSNESTSLKVFQVIGYLLIIIKIIVPLILIIMGSIDFAKAALSGDDKSTKEAAVQFSKRVLIGLIVFFIPTILDFFLSLISGASETASKYNNCTNCVFNPNNKNKCNPKGLTE